MSQDTDPAVHPNWQDVIAGAIFLVVGAFFAGDAWLHLPIGSALRMGPGFYPFALGLCLAVLGAVIAVKGVLENVEAGPFGAIPWRAVLILVPLPIFFGATIRGLGLVPTVFVMAFAATFAARQTSLRSGFLLAVGLTVFCVFIFSIVAGLPTPLFGAWLSPVNELWAQLLQGGV